MRRRRAGATLRDMKLSRRRSRRTRRLSAAVLDVRVAWLLSRLLWRAYTTDTGARRRKRARRQWRTALFARP
jgi:hypothetical protein